MWISSGDYYRHSKALYEFYFRGLFVFLIKTYGYFYITIIVKNIDEIHKVMYFDSQNYVYV